MIAYIISIRIENNDKSTLVKLGVNKMDKKEFYSETKYNHKEIKSITDKTVKSIKELMHLVENENKIIKSDKVDFYMNKLLPKLEQFNESKVFKEYFLKLNLKYDEIKSVNTDKFTNHEMRMKASDFEDELLNIKDIIRNEFKEEHHIQELTEFMKKNLAKETYTLNTLLFVKSLKQVLHFLEKSEFKMNKMSVNFDRLANKLDSINKELIAA